MGSGEKALDGEVYWTNVNGSTVMKVPSNGGASTVLASWQANPGAIAVDSAGVYWTNLSDGTVTRAPLDGGSPTVLASSLGHGGSIAVDSTSVYWTSPTTNRVMKVTPKY